MSESENTPETTQQVEEEEEPRPEIEPQAASGVTQDRDRDESKLRKEKEAGLVAESQPIKEERKRMTEPFSASEYRAFNESQDEPPRYPGVEGDEATVPSRYRKTNNPEKEARSQARAEARRTRRTMRLQQQQQEQTHYKIDVEGDSSDESSVDENYDVASIPESISENLTWRGRMQNVLHNHWFHLIIVALVSLDAFIVIFELLIEVGAFNNVDCEGTNLVLQAELCHYENRDRCFPLARQILENTNISASPSGTGNLSEVCRCGFRQGRRVCINRTEPLGVNPALVLHILSLIILSTFLVEIVLKLVAFRLKYFTHKFEVFDGTIVVISWILDVASIVEEEAFEAASLIIVLRLWRVVRIVNGALLSSKSQSDRDLENTRNEARKIVHALHRAQDKMDDLEAENVQMKREKARK